MRHCTKVQNVDPQGEAFRWTVGGGSKARRALEMAWPKYFQHCWREHRHSAPCLREPRIDGWASFASPRGHDRRAARVPGLDQPTALALIGIAVRR